MFEAAGEQGQRLNTNYTQLFIRKTFILLPGWFFLHDRNRICKGIKTKSSFTFIFGKEIQNYI